MIWSLIPSRAKLWALLAALGAAVVAFLRFDAARDQRRKDAHKRTSAALDAMRKKKEAKHEAETQDDPALVDRLTRR